MKKARYVILMELDDNQRSPTCEELEEAIEDGLPIAPQIKFTVVGPDPEC